MALATVVHVEGSSYRKPGARMLITSDGVLTGAISGGCLEGDALRKALYVIQRQTPMLVTYDTSDDTDENGLGAALGCNGIIQVLLEPLVPGHRYPMAFFQGIVAQRQPFALVTLYNRSERQGTQPGTCACLSESDWETTPTLPNDIPLGDIQTLATHALRTRASDFATVGTYEAFVEYVPPPVHLVVAGEGNDLVPLIALADLMGWSLTLLDGPRAYLSKMRQLPPTCRVLRRHEGIFEQVHLDERTALVCMTHHFDSDKGILEAAFNAYPALRYAGLLGAKKKKVRLLDEWAAANFVLTEDQLARLHCPVGLDLGGHTPEAVALSIVAHLQQVFERH
jgi:xanthine dehydrogenase accessory factor